MAARMFLQLSRRAGMALSAKRQQLLYVKACQGSMGFLMTRLACSHIRGLAMGIIMTLRALWQHILILHSPSEAVEGFMTVHAGESVSALAVFYGHEDIIMTPGAVQGGHFLRHLFRDLAVDIPFLTCRRQRRGQQ